MRKLDRKQLTITVFIGSLIFVGVLMLLTVPLIRKAVAQKNTDKAMQKASDAVALLCADQHDRSLVDGTVVKVDDHYFIYSNRGLLVSEDIPDTAAAITTAVVGCENGIVVYLLAGDGETSAYKGINDIAYYVLIDPTDDTVRTYTYSQVNEPVQRYLDEVSYEDAPDDASEVTKYLDNSKRFDRPVGCRIELEAGELTVYDNGSKGAYTVTVEKGPYTFYNITPGVGGEFYVKNEDEIIQRGHLRPTGTLRMIYSSTPGLQNMRDLGGLPCDGGTIKYNKLIRGGMVIDATDEDRNTWVKLLGIDHDLFVKTYSEIELEGKEQYSDNSPLGEQVSLYQNDLSAEDQRNKRNYANAKEQINGIINSLFDHAIAGETTYFHCLAGADRTGMVAILVEGVLGVPKNYIDKDYELTSFSTIRERSGVLYVSDINILRQYPGTSFRDKCVHYLLDCGISIEKINAFRKAVIDGDPELVEEIKLDEVPQGTNFCIPNGEGWIDGGRVSSIGEDRNDAGSNVLTNYIAVQNGDVVYVKNLLLSENLYSGLYAADKSGVSGFLVSTDGGSGFVKDILITNDWQVFTVDNALAGYMRLCGVPIADAE